MNLIALLSFFDEQPRHLAELVDSLAELGITHLVAVDGPYALYPSTTVASAADQHEALIDTAHRHGIHLTLHVPAEPWQGNEVEKRTATFALGHALAEPYEDWLYVADADEVVTSIPEDLISRLEKTSRNAGTVLLWYHSPSDNQPLRKLFRAHPQGIHVQGNHAKYISGEGETLWNPGHPTTEAAAEPFMDLRVRHRPDERTKPRLQARDRYYAVREKHHAELW